MVIGSKEIPKKLVYKIVVILVLATLVVSVLAYFGLIWREKKQFALAEKEIDALYAQIVEKIGKPDQEKKEKSCDRPNLKFEKGPLSCFTAMYLLYENKDFQDSNDIMKKVSGLGSGALRIGSVASDGIDFKEKGRRYGDQVFFQDLGTNSSLNCDLSYVFPAKEQGEFVKKSESAFEVGFDCGGKTMRQLFPMKN